MNPFTPLASAPAFAPAPGPLLHRHANAQQLAQAVADAVAAHLRQALASQPRASLVVSGGRTPVLMWQALASQPLAWNRVGITLADERWVPPSHPASNEALARAHLLQGPAAQAHFEPLYNGAAHPQDALADVEARLRQGVHWPADVVVLGMGADGHTASWFPGQALPQGDALCGALCMAVPAPALPNVPEPRLSLSPAALLGARHVLVQVQGADKEPVLLQAMQAPLGGEHHAADDAAALQLPIRRALWAPGVACQVHFSP